jgi:hypothetical protein
VKLLIKVRKVYPPGCDLAVDEAVIDCRLEILHDVLANQVNIKAR